MPIGRFFKGRRLHPQRQSLVTQLREVNVFLKYLAIVPLWAGLFACTTLPNSQFAMVCYNDNGSPDVGFGDGGRVLTDFSSSSSEGARAILHPVLFYTGPNGPEGNIVLAGDSTFGENHQFALARYREWDGVLEERFDGDGLALTGFPGTASASALDSAYTYYRGAYLVVAGKALVGDGHQFALARYRWNGSLDSDFDGDGRVLTDFPSATDEVARAVEIVETADGEFGIVVAGDALTDDGRQFALARYTWNGRLDESFDGDGLVLTDIPATASDLVSDIAVTEVDGEFKILVAGSVFVDDRYRFALARYHWDGRLDEGFNGDGWVFTDFPGTTSAYAYAVEVDTDGKAVVTGYARIDDDDERFALARYNSDGSLDPSFNHDGLVLTDFPFASGERAYDSTLDREGRIAVVGRAFVDGGWQFALARYDEDGSLDPAFDGDGLVLTDFPSTRHEVGRCINYTHVATHPPGSYLCAAGEAGGRIE